MRKREDFGSEQPPALSHLFEGPDGYLGTFGWLCGFSADASFLNNAAERFTRRTKRRRAAEGELVLGLILDRGSPRISTVDVPGVLHLPLPANGAFRLMHAKVALLGFRRIDADEGWLLRLIVSTGNWTRETLEESLDLACVVEIAFDQLDPTKAGQHLVDLAAGSDFLSALRSMVDAAPLGAASRVTQEAVASLDTWAALVGEHAPRELKPRFIDSRTRPLLPQIVERISRERRNYLAMGSGFYEGGAGTILPHVPASIVARLEEAGLLVPKPEIDLFVNPGSCQAIAGAMATIKAAGWNVRRPGYGPFAAGSRNLHAKFLFSAQFDGRSARCLKAWLYLGSGNLTRPGLLNAGPEGGNLEAGIVVAPNQLLWEHGRDGIAVQTVLPIGWDKATVLDADNVQPGGDMPERPPAYLAPPVTHLTWTKNADQVGRLEPPLGQVATFAVLDTTGVICAREGSAVVWPGAYPPEVTVTWNARGSCQAERVPVVDRHGRVAASVLPPVALHEVWFLLADFPLPPEDDTDERGDGDESAWTTAVSGHHRGDAPGAGRYAIRQVMELVEQIASRQTDLPPANWTAWCVRLSQTLEQAKEDPGIAFFRSMNLNPLTPLLAEPFRPHFARDRTTAEGRDYEEMLANVAAIWNVGGLEPMDAVT